MYSIYNIIHSIYYSILLAQEALAIPSGELGSGSPILLVQVALAIPAGELGSGSPILLVYHYVVYYIHSI